MRHEVGDRTLDRALFGQSNQQEGRDLFNANKRKVRPCRQCLSPMTKLHASLNTRCLLCMRREDPAAWAPSAIYPSADEIVMREGGIR